MPTQKQFLDNVGLTELLDELGQYLKGKLDALVSGTNIKTVNNTSLLGSGNVDVTEFTELTAEEGLMLYSKMMGGTVDQTAFNAMCEKINTGLSVGKQIRGTIISNGITFVIISVNGIRFSETSFMLVIYSTLWEYTRYSVSFEKENGDWRATRTEYISLDNHNIGENIRYEYDASFDGHIFSAVDEKVAQSASSENVDIPLLLASGATPGTAGAKYDADFKFNPSTNTLKVGTGTLTATNYSGNAATATSDSVGNNITETYATKSEVSNKLDKPIDLTGFIYTDNFQPRFPLTEEDARILTSEEQEMWNTILAGVTNKSEFTFFGRLVAFTDYLGWDTSYVHTWEYSTKNSVMEISVRHFIDGDDEKFYLSMPSEPSQYVFSDGLKTINSNSLIGSGDITVNEIASISTVESSVSGGNNVVTITDTNGNETSFSVKNGADGGQIGDVAIVQDTGDRTDAVMSQKVVTDLTKKVTAEDLNGTSEWIRAKLTEEGWAFGKYVNSSGGLVTNSNYCATPFIPMSNFRGHSITFCYRFNWGTACFAWYNANKTFISGLYYTCNAANLRTLTISDSASWDNVAYIRMTCDLNELPLCYIKDNTTNEYIFKGDEYLVEKNDSNNISLGFFANNLVVLEKGDSKSKVMSQKAVTDAIVDNPIRKSVFNGYYVFENAQSCYSVDTYDIDELKCISSLWVSDSFSAGPASYNYNLQHILGIVNSSDASNNFLSFYCEGYNLRLRFVKNGTKVLDYSLGSTSGRLIRRMFTMFDFYGKQVRIYLIDYNGTVTTLVDNYDFSELDLSNLQKVRIATSLGTSHSGKTMFNHVWINNYAIDAAGQLNRTVLFGQYDPISNYTFRTKPTEPSSYLFTNEGAASGITITLNDPYHKIVEVDRDTAGLVYNWGFYGFGNISNVERLYEICKIKFTNVESNVLLRGWSENGGYNYIIDPTTYECTRIPMNSNTGTVLEYTVEEGKTYYLLYGVGNGYSTRYNHYIGGHFTMEITEPKLFYLGSMNLCAECYDGKYFCGHIPFYSAGNFVPVLYGQFGSIDYPNLTGRIRIKSGNIQMYNGSVWKQINNS